MGLYAGMGFPWGSTLKSYFGAKSDREILRTSIEVIVFTHLRERVMLPGFGSPIHEAPFEPGDEILDEIIKGIFDQNVAIWDTRIKIIDVAVVTDETGHGKTVVVTYQDLATSPDAEDRFSFTIPSDAITSIG